MSSEACGITEREHRGGCHGPGAGRLRGFIQARILLALIEGPAHGYALLERLTSESGMADTDAGLLYRTLRQMEHEGLVASRWDTERQGPARRDYRIMPEGLDALHVWAARIGDTRRRLDAFLTRYNAYVERNDNASS